MHASSSREKRKKMLLAVSVTIILMTAALPFLIRDTDNGGDTLGAGSVTPMIAAGRYHSAALKNDGTVWTWGFNASGQLGNGETGTDTNKSVPVRVKGPEGIGYLDGVIAIAAGGYHSVALKNDGTVWTWGSNAYGQLGDGSSGITNNRSTPVQVKGPEGIGYLDGVIAIAAGDGHTVAVKNDGTVWTWGLNVYGQLGDGTAADKNTPVQVKGPEGIGYLDGVIAIAAGDGHTVALKNDGTVWTWGANTRGQLGDGTFSPRDRPVQVRIDDTAFLTDVTAIASGDLHSAALKNDGTVWAWGYNGRYQLGNGTTGEENRPVQVKGAGGSGNLTDITAIAAGRNHSAALKSDGTVWTWGCNDNGQLGDGTTTSRSTPVQVKGPDGTEHLTGVTAIAAGGDDSAAMKSDGTILTFGSNQYGQLGDGTGTDRNSPVSVTAYDGRRMNLMFDSDEKNDRTFITIAAIAAVAAIAAAAFLIIRKR